MSVVKKKIVYGSVIDILGTVAATLISFVVIRLYFQEITKDEFGLWLAINGVASLIALVDIGVDMYFITKISDDDFFYAKEFSVELSNTLVVKGIIVTLFSILGVIIFLVLPHLVTIHPSMLHLAKQTFALNVVFLVLNTFLYTFITIFNGRNHFPLTNTVLILGTIFSSLLTYLFLRLHLNILAFPLALIATLMLQVLVLFYLVRKHFPHIRISKFSFTERKEMFSYSFTFQLVKWAQMIRLQYLVIALNNFVGPSFVTTYNITNRIPQMVPAYMNKLVAPLLPSYAKLIAEGNLDKVRHLVIKLTALLLRLSVFAAIGIFAFNEALVRLWVGADKFGGIDMQFWLVFYMLIASLFSGFGIIVFSTRKFEKWSLFSLIEVFTVIILSISLWKFFGAIGLLAGFAIGSTISQFYNAFIALRQLDLNITFLIAKVFKRNIIPIVISISSLIIIKYLLDIETWFQLIVFGTGFTIAHFIPEIIVIVKSKETGLKQKLLKAFEL